MKFRKKFGLSLSIALAAVIAFPAAGSALTVSQGAYPGRNLEKIVVVDYANAKEAAASGKSSGGYKLTGYRLDLAKNSCYLNSSSPAGALSAIKEATIEWDSATSAELFGNVNTSSTAKYGVLDKQNSIEFGMYSGSSGVIAVTAYWVDRTTKTIVEFDMLYNTYYAWGDATKDGSKVMDIQNIATHEFGHAFGLADIYSGAYSKVTMYGYSNYGETSKRDLEPQDIAGIQKIYGK